jgi:hypothetical protein
VIKLRRMRWAGHVAGVGERRGVYRILVGKPEGKRPLAGPRSSWEDNIIWILRKRNVGYGVDRAGSGYGQMAGTRECGNELLGSIKFGEFLD